MKTILNLLLAIILITSCSVQKLNDEKTAGKYQSKKGDPFTELTINQDNTFKYRQEAGLYNSISEGTWMSKDEKIVLMSNPSFKTNMIEVSEIEINKSRKIKIYNDVNQPYSDVVVKIIYNGGNLIKMTNNDGVIELDNNLIIQSFNINYLGENYSYNILKDTSSFEVVLYADNLDKKYFNNEKVIIRKNKIILEGIKLFLQE